MELLKAIYHPICGEPEKARILEFKAVEGKSSPIMAVCQMQDGRLEAIPLPRLEVCNGEDWEE